ncbi:hypothetical protein [Spiroplasma endosymbiont of Stenodema calcarata]|uniref:hypothetical protein n=1 Tax=Spiroplasma endosymbiont of Stenodema calcarata TaxID=3139328 RepID=UPI003CCB1AC8
MKKLLSIFTTVSLLTPTVNTIIICNKAHKYIPDDDSNNNGNDIEIMNNINARVKKHLNEWWNTKTKIDITEYPDQMEKFKELVTNLKHNDGTILIGKAINEWRFLDQLVTAFQTEFNNINREIKDEYSNYYHNTMPLSLEPNDISFTLHHINFDKLTKLLKVDDKTDNMGITINVNISYQVKFKSLEQRDKCSGLVVICNNLQALSGIQQNLENYFITFIDELFKKQQYEVIDEKATLGFINTANFTIWPIIDKALKEKGILFNNAPVWDSYYEVTNVTPRGKHFYKTDSVLAWAGEGYDPEKLTVEKFLEFYKQEYFKLNINGDYYIKASVSSFVPRTFTIENLPFNYIYSSKELVAPIKVLIPKDILDEKLNKFTETTMRLWQYYQLETYNDKLVFKLTEDDFSNLLKVTSDFSLENNSSATFYRIFDEIFRLFDAKVVSKDRTTVLRYNRNLMSKVNLIKEKKSLLLKLFWKQDKDGVYARNQVNFMYYHFTYSFFFIPDKGKTNGGMKDEFLQTIEFKVV